MQKTLLLYSRICPTESQFTIQLFDELKALPNVTAVKIDGTEPFDVPYEQEFIKGFDNVIILFTMNWFNFPWSFSRYIAEVWRTFPFSLDGINFYTVVTTGSPLKAYSDAGLGWTNKQYLNNFGSVMKRLNGNWVDHFVFHNCVAADPKGEDFQNYIKEVKEYYLEKINK